MSKLKTGRPNWCFYLGDSWINVGEYQNKSYFLDYEPYLKKTLWMSTTYLRFKEQVTLSTYYIYLAKTSFSFDGIKILKTVKVENEKYNNDYTPFEDIIFEGPFDVRKKIVSLAKEQAEYLRKKSLRFHKVAPTPGWVVFQEDFNS